MPGVARSGVGDVGSLQRAPQPVMWARAAPAQALLSRSESTPVPLGARGGVLLCCRLPCCYAAVLLCYCAATVPPGRRCQQAEDCSSEQPSCRSRSPSLKPDMQIAHLEARGGSLSSSLDTRGRGNSLRSSACRDGALGRLSDTPQRRKLARPREPLEQRVDLSGERRGIGDFSCASRPRRDLPLGPGWLSGSSRVRSAAGSRESPPEETRAVRRQQEVTFQRAV